VSHRTFFRRLVKPLLERQPRLVHVGSAVYVTPIRHVLRAIPVEATARGTGFTVSTELEPTAAGNERGYWGSMRHKSGYVPKRNFWLWNDASLPESVLQAIEDEALPVLLPLDDLETARQGFVDNYAEDQGAYDWVLAWFHLCCGDFEPAHALWSKTKGRGVIGEVLETKFGPLAPMLVARGDRLTADEKRQVFASLHQQEERAIRAFKLEKYWRPSPFPAEERGLV